MTENVASSDDVRAQQASEQARLRRERREAKLKAGGSARLNKITGMDGRITGDNEPTPPPAAPAASPAVPTPQPSDDPAEVDISEHFYAPNATRRTVPAAPEGAMSEAQLRQMMLGFDTGSMPGQQPNFPGPGAAGPGAGEDPIMQMMSQMMAGGGPGAGFPPGAAPPFPGMPQMPGMPGMQQASSPDPSTSLWRLVHAIVALGLGVYIAILTPFTGTLVERQREALGSNPLAYEMDHHKKLFFWVFCTAEALLLSTRFFLLDKARAPPAGIAGMVVGFIPEPIKGYIMVLMRYGQIFSTVRADILACMFVLGVCSWWRS